MPNAGGYSGDRWEAVERIAIEREADRQLLAQHMQGSETSSAYEGRGELSEHIILDFTKPTSSAAGNCFPQMGIGTIHTLQGDYNFYNQGETCVPPHSGDVAPGFGNAMLHSIVTGGTGRFQHAIGTLAVTAVSHPPAIILYHTAGAFAGVERAP